MSWLVATLTTAALFALAGADQQCSSPFFLFTGPISLFLNTTFPSATAAVPFPPTPSFLDRCPNINSSRQSCCDESSINYVSELAAVYDAGRAKFESAKKSLTLQSLYGILSNTTDADTNSGPASLNSEQLSHLNASLTIIHDWASLGLSCADHWMAHIAGLFCLACDPITSSHYSGFVPDWARNPNGFPTLYLSSSTCTSVWQHCAPLFDSFFLQWPVLLDRLQLIFTANNTNSTEPVWHSYQAELERTSRLGQSLITIDMCVNDDGKTVCKDWFCRGSWLANDGSIQYGQHAFRGLNYQFNTATLDRLVDVNAIMAHMICVLRLLHSNNGWPFNSHAFSDSDYGDHCPRLGNTLSLLFPRHYEWRALPSSMCVDRCTHACPTRDACNPTYKDDCVLSNSKQWCPHISDPGCDFDCSAGDPIAYVNFTNSATLPSGHGWNAYEVGCQLNLSQSICSKPRNDSVPSNSSSGDSEGEGVSAVLMIVFVSVASVSVTALLAIAAYCHIKHRRSNELRRAQQVREWLHSEESASNHSRLFGNNRPRAVSEIPTPLDTPNSGHRYRALIDD